MGNFLLVVPSDNSSKEGRVLFHHGLDLAHRLKGQNARLLIERDWSYAATFPRLNGSGTVPVVDVETGSWLLAVGSWFHERGFNVGEEGKLLNRYIDVGPDHLARELEGFYVVLVGDARTRETILITDVIGSCHCFTRTFESMIAVSGSSLLLAGLQDFRLDLVACQEFLSTGVVYEDRTFYREVRKVPPASILKLGGGALKGHARYWKVLDLQPDSLDERASTEQLWAGLKAAATTIGKVFDRPVCDLTGGYDSRSVVAAFFDAGIKFSTTVSGSSNDPDVVVARGLSELLGIPHLHLAPQGKLSADALTHALQLADGEYNLIEYSGILEVHRILAQQFGVSINGSFGEVARGFWWEVLYPEAGKYKPINPVVLAKKRYATESVDMSMFPQGSRQDMVSHMAGVIERTNAGSTPYPNTVQMDNVYLVMRMQRWQGRIASSTDQLWPCLSPFMFRSVLETMLRIKSSLRRKSFIIRKMLANFQPRAANFPLEYGYPAIPVTWESFYKFWPLPVHYAQRIFAKLWHARPDECPPDSVGRVVLSPRLQLWQDREVCEALQPKVMLSAAIFDMKGLQGFLEKARQASFTGSDQWARLLSLEWALRALRDVRQSQHAKIN